MPSTPSIYKRWKSFDYRILISPKKQETHRRLDDVFFVCVFYLENCNRHSCYEYIHDDKMTYTSTHNE